MSLSYTDRLKQTQKPREAMLILAEGIDAILLRLAEVQAPATDGWGDVWDAPPPEDEPELIVRDEAAINAVKRTLELATDPDDIRALEARLAILTDDGQPLDIAPQAGRRAAVTDDVVELPAVTLERKVARSGWATERRLWEFLPELTELEVLDAYSAGGPEWLYANRDAVMQMPIDWRRDLITDLEIDSPAAAQEMARDILKVETEDPRD